MEVILVAMMVIATAMIMVPRAWRRKVFGYVNLADFIGGFYILSHFAAPGASEALYIGVMSMLGLTIVLRVARAKFGAEKLACNGDTSISAVVAGLFTQGIRWLRAIFKSLFTGKAVERPEPLSWEWVEDLPGVSLIEAFNRFVTTV